jgi:hypothetical protein
MNFFCCVLLFDFANRLFLPGWYYLADLFLCLGYLVVEDPPLAPTISLIFDYWFAW